MEGDGLQIFIYLLVIIASIIGGIVKNSAKKKEEQQRRERQAEAKKRMATEVQEPEPKSSSNPFEEFLRRQLEEFEEEPFVDDVLVEEPSDTVVEPSANPKKHIEGNAAFDSTDQALLSDNMKEEGFSISNSIEEIENEGEVYNFSYDNISEDEITDVKDEEEFFNARKALIYSEIFKRPEY